MGVQQRIGCIPPVMDMHRDGGWHWLKNARGQRLARLWVPHGEGRGAWACDPGTRGCTADEMALWGWAWEARIYTPDEMEILRGGLA